MSDKCNSPTDPVSHAPGPWVAAAGPSSIVGWPVVGPYGRAVATVHYLRGDTPEGKRINAEAGANARLIAAAPDLLAACKAALGAFEHVNAINWDDLRRAIAKAEGRS